MTLDENLTAGNISPIRPALPHEFLRMSVDPHKMGYLALKTHLISEHGISKVDVDRQPTTKSLNAACRHPCRVHQLPLTNYSQLVLTQGGAAQVSQQDADARPTPVLFPLEPNQFSPEGCAVPLGPFSLVPPFYRSRFCLLMPAAGRNYH